MFDDFIYWVNVVTVLFSGAAMVFSGKNLRHNRKLAEHIPVYIEKNGKKEYLDLEIIRKDFNRSELFGILGSLEKSGKFDIEYFSSKKFYKQLSDLQKSKKDEFVIYLKDSDRFEKK